MKKENKTISEFLEGLRVKKNVSVNRVSKDLQIPLRTAQNAFNGHSLPNSYLFMRMVRYLKASNSALSELSKKIIKES